VVALADVTTVSFALPPSNNVSLSQTPVVTFLDRSYRPGEIITVVLDIFGSFQLQAISDYYDLTGCRVYANNPIAVFSGNNVSQVRKLVMAYRTAACSDPDILN
jgi:hypothetical protein